MKKLWVKVLLGVSVVALLLSMCACDKDTDKEEEQQGSSQGDVEDVLSEIGSMAEESAGVEVGEYVTPDSSCFAYEGFESGISITSYTGDAKAIIIPETIDGYKVVEIASSAFTNVEVLGVELPNTVTKIDPMGFYHCTTLVEVKFGAGMREVGSQAFEGCMALSSVELNEGLETIDERAFGFTSSLKGIEMPSSLKSIGLAAFGLSGIESVRIPGSVETIGEQAFSTCNNLEIVYIEDGVNAIGSNAFEGCPALMSVRIPASVEVFIRDRVFFQSENVTIIAPAGSTAEKYANEVGIAFTAE